MGWYGQNDTEWLAQLLMVPFALLVVVAFIVSFLSASIALWILLAAGIVLLLAFVVWILGF